MKNVEANRQLFAGGLLTYSIESDTALLIRPFFSKS